MTAFPFKMFFPHCLLVLYFVSTLRSNQFCKLELYCESVTDPSVFELSPNLLQDLSISHRLCHIFFSL
ncbi:hypothetical protein TorRG33x02_181330 [Trema orientale]|uniref:LRR domain containing protein n=1 Tax=Trema orientale TaxID=63057 RepID=A0A2P5EKL0_TREOI|nr:hypothetical protein TorRG33x02_181330 [Trema orientale]